MPKELRKADGTEHDYATFVITSAMVAEDGDQEYIYQIETSNPESATEGQGEMEMLEGSYAVVPERVEVRKQRYRRENPGMASGYWSEEDVHRLLKVYLKHIKSQPLLKGKPTNHMWHSIIRDFDLQKKFTNMQVKSKIQRLRYMGLSILRNNEGNTTKWPFWKQVSEMLEVEGTREVDDKEEEDITTSTDPGFSHDDEEKLLRLYKRFMMNMVEATGTNARGLVWSKIAKFMKRPRYQVMQKFQALKARWRHLKESNGSPGPNDVLLVELGKIMGAEKKALQAKRQTQKEHNEPDRPLSPTAADHAIVSSKVKWKSESTEVLLQKMEAQLLKLRTSGIVPTRRSIIKKVAQEIGIPWEAVQVKMCSLATNYRKRQQKNLNNYWMFEESMGRILDLEKIIWYGGSTDEPAEPKSARQLPLHYKEPAWFKEYRLEVEKRHEDRVGVLKKLFNVMKKLSQK